MPSRPGLSLLPFKLDPEFLQEIDAVRGGKSRSHFIREALAEKLASMGRHIGEEMVFPPDRARIKEGPPSASDAANPASKPVDYKKSLAADARKRKKSVPPQ